MQLYPFQEEAVQRMVEILRARGGVYNASDMGTGKSCQAIVACNRLGFERVLIICPKIMCLVWEDEIKSWGKFHGKHKVISYGMAVNRIEELNRVSWDCIIIDEAHYLKSTKAKRTKAILNNLWNKIPNSIFLSGTPFTATIMDCWTTFSRLAPEDFPDFWKFAHRYTHVTKTLWGDKFEGIRNHEELGSKIRAKFFIRYKKEDVLKDLPAKVWQKISLPASYAVQLSQEEQKANEQYYAQVREALKRNSYVPMVPPLPVATYRKEQGIKKVGAIYEFSKDLLDQDIPLVIFCHHREVIKQLAEKLKEYRPVVIHGETSNKERKDSIEAFQEGKTNCFIGQLTAASVGITLTRSSTCILGEPDWSPANTAQAVDRLHRIGQKNTVVVYYLVVQDSLDEKIIEVVMDKARTFGKVLNG